MTGIELFIWILLVIGWVLFQVIRRVLKPPRPLGTIDDAADAPPAAEPLPPPARPRVPVQARDSPLEDVEWGRTPPMPAPPRMPPPLRTPPPPRLTPPPRVAPLPQAVADEPFAWAADRAGSELALARELGRRQAERRRAAAQPVRRRHPYRPRLRTVGDLRAAVVVQTVLGPCRAFEPYRSPDQS